MLPKHAGGVKDLTTHLRAASVQPMSEDPSPIPPFSSDPLSARRFTAWMGVAALTLLGLDLAWYAARPAGPDSVWMTCGLIPGGALFFVSGHLLGAMPWDAVPRRARWVAFLAVVVVSILALIGRSPALVEWVAGLLSPGLAGAAPMVTLAVASLLLRTVLPMILVSVVHRESLPTFGFALPTGGRTLWLYALFLAALAPLVWWAAARPDFAAVYPLSRGLVSDGVVDWGAFAAFQGAYLLLLLSGESFWRGYLLFALERDLGRGALAFMVILYSISHWGKPLAETLAAIVAGVALGALALRHRSFLLGWLLHAAVATGMELAAFARAGVSLR